MAEISKEYAGALFMLALEKGKIDEFSCSLATVKSLIEEQPEYIDVLDSPAILLSQRLEMIDEAFGGGFCEDIVSAIKLMCEGGDVDQLVATVDEFDKLVREHQNRTTATVYYVSELTAEQKERLAQRLKAVSGKNVDVEYVKDESLIGGIKILLGDKLLDGSLAGKLNKVKGVISE